MGFCKERNCRRQTHGAYCYDHAKARGFRSACESREEPLALNLPPVIPAQQGPKQVHFCIGRDSVSWLQFLNQWRIHYPGYLVSSVNHKSAHYYSVCLERIEKGDTHAAE